LKSKNNKLNDKLNTNEKKTQTTESKKEILRREKKSYNSIQKRPNEKNVRDKRYIDSQKKDILCESKAGKI